MHSIRVDHGEFGEMDFLAKQVQKVLPNAPFTEFASNARTSYISAKFYIALPSVAKMYEFSCHYAMHKERVVELLFRQQVESKATKEYYYFHYYKYYFLSK